MDATAPIYYSDGRAVNQMYQVEILKIFLENWKMALIPLKSVLMWDKSWHPYAIVCSISVFYFFIWLIDFNFFTTLISVSLLINFTDFIIPIVCKSLYGSAAWTGHDEKIFHDICCSIVGIYQVGSHCASSFCRLRQTRQITYYILTMGILLKLLWLASSVNCTLLIYISTTVMLLLPGLHNQGYISFLEIFLPSLPKVKTFKVEGK